jgi:hypothetical protein
MWESNPYKRGPHFLRKSGFAPIFPPGALLPVSASRPALPSNPGPNANLPISITLKRRELLFRKFNQPIDCKKVKCPEK